MVRKAVTDLVVIFSGPSSAGIVTRALRVFLIVSLSAAATLLLRPAYAQIQYGHPILGIEAKGKSRIAWRIHASGEQILFGTPVELSQGRRFGYLWGNFEASAPPILLRVRRPTDNTVVLDQQSGSRFKRKALMRLRNPLGSAFFALAGFDISSDGVEDIALIDASTSRLRWLIIENPLGLFPKEHPPFILGKRGSALGWTRDQTGELTFVSTAVRAKKKQVVVGTY